MKSVTGTKPLQVQMNLPELRAVLGLAKRDALLALPFVQKGLLANSVAIPML